MIKNLKHIDIQVIAILLVFMGISTAVILSATQGTIYSGFHIKNVIFYIAGFFVMLAVATFDYRLVISQSKWIYAFGIVLLVFLFFFGVTRNGATSWFNLGIFYFQPAELVKLTIILALARYLSLKEGEPLKLIRDIIPLLVLVLIPFFLVLMQPDLGNAIIYFVILVGMLWVGNMRLSHFLIGFGAMVVALVIFIYMFVNNQDLLMKYVQLAPHQAERIQTFIDPMSDPKGAGYQVNQSIMAIGSGQLFGFGFLEGSSIRKGFIPYPYSDSIFVVIGEEYGFIGASFLILLYFLLIYRMIMIALTSEEMSGSYIIVGIISMFVFQIFENIGMLLGIMPLTGITLPFISYGGSSLLINMISIGLVLSIKIHQTRLSFN